MMIKNKRGDLEEIVKVAIWILFFVLASFGIYYLLNMLIAK